MTPTPFYTNEFVAWLTAGWLRDDDPVRVWVQNDADHWRRVPWSFTLDADKNDDYPFETPQHLRREVA